MITTHARVHWKIGLILLSFGLLLASATSLLAAPAPLGNAVMTLLGDLRGRIEILPTRPGSIHVRDQAASTLSYSSTIEQVAQRVGFRPLIPAALPNGYQFQGAEAIGPGTVNCCFNFAGDKASNGTMQRFDGPEGTMLLIQYELPSGTFRWSAADRTYQAIDVRGRSGWFIDGYWERQGEKLVWRTGEQGAWRQLLWSDEGFAYALRGHLSLSTLRQIAESLR